MPGKGTDTLRRGCGVRMGWLFRNRFARCRHCNPAGIDALPLGPCGPACSSWRRTEDLGTLLTFQGNCSLFLLHKISDKSLGMRVFI